MWEREPNGFLRYCDGEMVADFESPSGSADSLDYDTAPFVVGPQSGVFPLLDMDCLVEFGNEKTPCADVDKTLADFFGFH